MEADYKFQVDYAKSNRSSCTKCKDSISQNSLRVARLVQAANFDGKIPRWFHFSCFFGGKIAIQSTSEIKNFDSIRWEDQEKIRGHITSVVDAPSAKTQNFSVKLSIPNAVCCKCKDELMQERHMINEGTKKPTHYHFSCFLKSGRCPDDVSSLNGFKKLSKVDQQAIQLAHSQASNDKLKRASKKDATADEPSKKRQKVEEESSDFKEALRMQSKKLWILRDKLETEVSKDALVGLLEYNDQFVPSGLSNLLDSVSDAMYFGALSICPACNNGPLHYENGQYKCSAMATDWVPCVYRTLEPKRQKFRVPKEYFDVEFLKKYKSVVRKRLFDPDARPPVGIGPLTGYKLFIMDGPFEKYTSKAELTKAFTSLGATITNKVGSTVIVISTAKLLDSHHTNPSSILESAQRLGLRVIDQFFAEEFKADQLQKPSSEQILNFLTKHTISDWPVKSNLPKTTDQRLKTFEKDVEDSVRLTLKDGAVVDPQSNLAEKATVMKDTRGRYLTAVLGMVDLIKGSNSFYKLQLLKSDKSDQFWLFRAWGRIGTNIGGTKTEKFYNFQSAMDAFEDLYLDKTGNEWRNKDNFQKKPHKFYEMDLDYGNLTSSNQLDLSTKVPSKLHPALLSLMQFICDVKSMEKAMLEFELDLKKMPLGKLSKKQIHEACGILNVLDEILRKSKSKKKATTDSSAIISVDQTHILSESTRFYTLIPHDFGMQTPPLLDNKKIIRTKLRMLEDLLEIELAYKMLQDQGRSDQNPLDRHYEQLNNELELLDTESEDYQQIMNYVRNTHGATHSHYSLEVIHVFKVNRADEDERYRNCKLAKHNKQLLWHGSRRTNWMGILSQGLRVAPPEAPVTGYMFGKGVYFADMVSKSANYCFSTQSQPEGLLLLCEVILGDMHECLNADPSKLPPEKHSRKGLGAVEPDPSMAYINPDGVVYPVGTPVPTNIKESSLQYNEYVVYDVSQIKQKYLVRVKFVFK